jgi:hypothetical protein
MKRLFLIFAVIFILATPITVSSDWFPEDTSTFWTEIDYFTFTQTYKADIPEGTLFLVKSKSSGAGYFVTMVFIPKLSINSSKT